jgi:hypothetical protein
VEKPVLVRGREDLLAVMRSEREAKGFTHLEMDARVGLASGHYGKIEHAGAAWGKQAFRMTHSVECILEALDLELILAPRGLIEASSLPRDVRIHAETLSAPTPQRRRKAKPKLGIVAEYRARVAARASLQLQAAG